jgi:hypothetical protein
VRDADVVEVAVPAVLEDPGFDARLPGGAFGSDVALHAVGGGVDFVDMDADHGALGGVEVLVVEDARAFAVNPFAVRAEVGLHGAAFDLIEDAVLDAVGVRDVVMVEGEESAAEERGEDEDGHREPVEADAAGLHGGHLVVFREDAEGDQDGHQDAHRR